MTGRDPIRDDPNRDFANYRAQRVFDGLPLTEPQRQDAFAWAISQPPNATDDYLLTSFRDMCRRRGIQLTEED
jgi:hypothetical protein